MRFFGRLVAVIPDLPVAALKTQRERDLVKVAIVIGRW